MAKESWFLILTAIGVALVSLGYGVNPKLGMPLLYGIDIESVNQINMYRAIMGLYLAISLYWIVGALNENVKLSDLGEITLTSQIPLIFFPFFQVLPPCPSTTLV